METDVFQYLDYRQFLRDAYAELKASSPKFSHRYFARKAGLRSPSHLSLVMTGKRNLTAETARRFAQALALNKEATRFFINLVGMNQAKSTKDRAQYYEELARIPRYRAVKTLERNQYSYYELWYCIPIRELVASPAFQEDPDWIARQVRPSISRREAEKALSLLLALGMVTRDASGRLRQATPLLTTGPEIRSLASRSFHREMLHVAAGALDAVAMEEREVGGVTLRLTDEQLLHLKRRLFEIRQEILQLDGIGRGKEAVYHFAFQLFPVSQPLLPAPAEASHEE